MFAVLLRRQEQVGGQFRAELGCRSDVWLEDAKHPVFTTYETWKDQAAAKAHMYPLAMTAVSRQCKEGRQGEQYCLHIVVAA